MVLNEVYVLPLAICIKTKTGWNCYYLSSFLPGWIHSMRDLLHQTKNSSNARDF